VDRGSAGTPVTEGKPDDSTSPYGGTAGSLHLGSVVWKKSGRSNGNGGNNCVEVAFLDHGVAVRDSNDPSGPVLMFTAAEWDAFVGGAKDGEFDRAG
jgi:hypothetical protein